MNKKRERELGSIALSPDGKFVAVWVEDDSGRFWHYVPIVWGIKRGYPWPKDEDAESWT